MNNAFARPLERLCVGVNNAVVRVPLWSVAIVQQ